MCIYIYMYVHVSQYWQLKLSCRNPGAPSMYIIHWGLKYVKQQPLWAIWSPSNPDIMFKKAYYLVYIPINDGNLNYVLRIET